MAPKVYKKILQNHFMKICSVGLKYFMHMFRALLTSMCNTVHYNGAALWLASHNIDQNPWNTITHSKSSISLPICTLLITQHSASWNVATMDVTVLEAAISHFLPFTSPLSKFSAGCFSSCKFQVKNNSCKCRVQEKFRNKLYRECKQIHQWNWWGLHMSWKTYSVSHYHYNSSLQYYTMQLT